MTAAHRPHRVAVDPLSPDPAALAAPASALAAGALVAFPTETVYGLGANAWDAEAVARVFALKGRPAADPLIVHVLDWAAALALLDPALLEASGETGGETGDETGDETVSEASGEPRSEAGGERSGESPIALAARLAQAFWPGPLTLVLPRHPALPAQVTGGGSSVAVRAPAHPVARQLLRLAGVPVAAPSANRFGGISPTRAGDVLAELGAGLDWLVDGGPCPIGVESTVLDLRGPLPRILRPGGVSREALVAFLPLGLAGPGEALAGRSASEASGIGVLASDDGAALPSPGLLSRHYAPRRARLSLYVGPPAAQREAVLAVAAAARAAGQRVSLLAPAEDAALLRAALPEQAAAAGPPVTVAVLGSRADLAAAARDLYRRLRDLDAGGVDVILALDLGDAGLGMALRDRLSRAAEGRVIQA